MSITNFRFPYEMTEAMVRRAQEGGQASIRGISKGRPEGRDQARAQMFEKQVIKEMAPHALRFVKTMEDLPTQHIIVFEKVDNPQTKRNRMI